MRRTLLAVSAAWNRDWKPGKYPDTVEEREAAAKKYGMRVEDYEPYDPEVGALFCHCLVTISYMD